MNSLPREILREILLLTLECKWLHEMCAALINLASVSKSWYQEVKLIAANFTKQMNLNIFRPVKYYFGPRSLYWREYYREGAEMVSLKTGARYSIPEGAVLCDAYIAYSAKDSIFLYRETLERVHMRYTLKFLTDFIPISLTETCIGLVLRVAGMGRADFFILLPREESLIEERHLLYLPSQLPSGKRFSNIDYSSFLTYEIMGTVTQTDLLTGEKRTGMLRCYVMSCGSPYFFENIHTRKLIAELEESPRAFIKDSIITDSVIYYIPTMTFIRWRNSGNFGLLSFFKRGNQFIVII